MAPRRPTTNPTALGRPGDRRRSARRAPAPSPAAALDAEFSGTASPSLPERQTDGSGEGAVAGPTFAELGVPAQLAGALGRSGIDRAFPIQTATLPDSLAGRDVLGRGRTGSGKTLAFALPLLARLASNGSRTPGRPRGLVLAPTRELVAQIDAVLRPLADAVGLRTLTIFGGVGQGPQVTALRKGVDVVVACPGRLEDLLGQGHASLDRVEVTVLDEADHMADLGFLPVVRRLLDRTPADGQRLLFSATLDNGIDVLVRRYLSAPVTHSVDPPRSAVSTMAHHVLHVRHDDRLPVLVELTSAPGRTVVFTRTKHRAKQLARQLRTNGVPAVEMHGNLAQAARTRNLAAFSDGRATAMVATDIAARGIHVDDVALVVHADPPVEHKAYLHRSGRTARAGAAGTVVTLATEGQHEEVRQLARRAGVAPQVTVAAPGHAVLEELAPGPRALRSAAEIDAALTPPFSPSTGASGVGAPTAGRRRRGAGEARRSGSAGAGRADAGRSGRSRSGGPSGEATGTRSGSAQPRRSGGGPDGRPSGGRPSRAPQAGRRRSR